MKTLTLSAKILRNLGAIEIGGYVVYAIDAEYGGGWKVAVAGDEDKALAHKATIEEALADIESRLEG